jgi:kynureninase
MGHADTFGFDPMYEPHPGVQRHLTGTPPVIALEAMAGAAAIWREVDAEALGAKHRSLSELAVALVAQRCADFGMTLGSPAAYDQRGGHVSFQHEGAGRIVEALVERGAVASFRHPNAIRFGLSPLALSHEDLWWAVERLHEVLAGGLWRDERFSKSAV